MSKFESMIIGIGSSSATTSTDSSATPCWKLIKPPTVE